MIYFTFLLLGFPFFLFVVSSYFKSISQDFCINLYLTFFLIPSSFFFFEHIYYQHNLFWLKLCLSFLFCGGFILNIDYIKDNLDKLKVLYIFHFIFLILGIFTSDISFAAEGTTDLHFLQNYLNAKSLPAENTWIHFGKFDYYYSFFYYIAALFSRVTGLNSRFTYQIFLIFSFTISAYFGFSYVAKYFKKYLAFILTFLIIFASTGVAIFAPYLRSDGNNIETKIFDERNLVQVNRFVGMGDKDFNNSLIYTKPENNELNSDNFVYTFQVAALHPIVFGFILFFLMIYLVKLREDSADNIFIEILLGFICLQSFVIHAWVFPLFVIFLSTLVVYEFFLKKKTFSVSLNMFIGALVAFCLYFQLFESLTLNIIPSTSGLRLVPATHRTPLTGLIMTFWPILIPAIYFLFKRSKGTEKFFGLSCILIFLFSEIFHVQELVSGRFLRTNSTMKWWGLIYSGFFLALFPPFLKSIYKNRIFFFANFLLFGKLLLLSCVFFFTSYTLETDKKFDNYEGYKWLTDEHLFYFHELDKKKYGRVLLPVHTDGEAWGLITSAVTLANKPIYLSSPGLLGSWGINWNIISPHLDEINNFYNLDNEKEEFELFFEKIDYIIGPRDLSDRIQRYKVIEDVRCFNEMSCVFRLES